MFASEVNGRWYYNNRLCASCSPLQYYSVYFDIQLLDGIVALRIVFRMDSRGVLLYIKYSTKINQDRMVERQKEFIVGHINEKVCLSVGEK